MSTTHRSTQHSRGLAPVAATEPPPQARVVVIGLVAALVLGGLVYSSSGQVPAILFALGLSLGFVLFHSRFGFTSAWRQLVAVRQGKALRAHMLMLAVACTLFAPILANGIGFKDVPALPTLAPIGFGLFVGSFMFGVGMQLGGSCASGTLFAIGSGHTAILLTLGGFIGGATLGAYQFPWWTNELPSHAPISLTDWFGGYAGAWAASLVLMGLVVGATYLLARNRSVPDVEPA
ncbi:YeeE/YedE thiosulfate transporter family protein, partial [Nocardioides hankookensis]